MQRLPINILCFSNNFVIVGSIYELSPARIIQRRRDAPYDGIRYVGDAELQHAGVDPRDMRPRNAGRYLLFEWELGYVHCCLTNANYHGVELNNNRFCSVLVSAEVERGPVLYTDPQHANTGRINSHITLSIMVTRDCKGYYYHIM